MPQQTESKLKDLITSKAISKLHAQTQKITKNEEEKDKSHDDMAELQLGRKSGRKPGVITACRHTHLKHFAKGMCNHCYHRYGRKSLATECKHSDRKMYSKGKCQNCYINEYNKVKRQGKKQAQEDELNR